MKRKSELPRNVMQQMGLLHSTESPSAEDAALIEGNYDAKYAEWRRRGYVWWQNTSRDAEEIPSEVWSVIIDLMELQAEKAFGVATKTVDVKRDAEAELLKRLRALNARPASGETTPFSSF